MASNKQHQYPITEIFYSIQGEGRHAGQAAVFIRISGCNFECAFCDSDHVVREHMTAAEIAIRCWQELDYFGVPAGVLVPIILTGGEPTIHDLEPIVDALRHCPPDESNLVCIHLETNGSNPTPSALFDWVTWSPKKELQGDLPRGFRPPDEFKFLVDQSGFLVNPIPYRKWASQYRFHAAPEYYVQPLYGDPKALEKAIEICRRNPECWKLSVQLHKLIGVR